MNSNTNLFWQVPRKLFTRSRRGRWYMIGLVIVAALTLLELGNSINQPILQLTGIVVLFIWTGLLFVLLGQIVQEACNEVYGQEKML